MPSTSADAWGERLPRHLGLWSAIAVLVGSTIGSGIFRVPAGVAERLQEPGPVMLAWIIGGAIALFGALTLAELAAALPRSGGVFAYLLEGFGPLPAFLFGWSELTVIRASALGAIGDPRGRSALAAAVHDEDPYVAEEAFRALARLDAAR